MVVWVASCGVVTTVAWVLQWLYKCIKNHKIDNFSQFLGKILWIFTKSVFSGCLGIKNMVFRLNLVNQKCLYMILCNFSIFYHWQFQNGGKYNLKFYKLWLRCVAWLYTTVVWVVRCLSALVQCPTLDTTSVVVSEPLLLSRATKVTCMSSNKKWDFDKLRNFGGFFKGSKILVDWCGVGIGNFGVGCGHPPANPTTWDYSG